MSVVVRVLLVLLLGGATWKVYAVRAQLAAAGADTATIARLAARLDKIPLDLANGTYQGRPDPEPDWIVERSGADAAASIVYVDAGGKTYRLWVGGAVRASGFFHKPDRCMTSSGWSLIEDGLAAFTAFPTNQSAPQMHRLVAGYGPQRMLVYFWFQSGRDVSASNLASSYFRFRNLLTNQLLLPSYVVSVYIPSGGDVSADEERALAFLRTLGPALDSALTPGD